MMSPDVLLVLTFYEKDEHMTAGGNCQTFSSSTVISYSNTGAGAPKVYQETAEMRSAPGGIRETRRTVRDSDSGLEQMSIGHHIRDRAHILQRSRNHRTGDQEERQDYINLDESEPSFPLLGLPASWPAPAP
ncbi:Myeloid leukemia factor 2, partial [Eschrichtius robustus]|nr:Myeloid leukemia factor 2 [Eschrichtius robustus]